MFLRSDLQIRLVIVAAVLVARTDAKSSLRQNEGYFWHITDMHFDPTYRLDSMAWSCNGATGENEFGKYGDFRCDAPIALLNSAVDAMRNIKDDVDFLIWTGDDTPHIYNDTILNEEVVTGIILNQTQILMDRFPETTVYSALGNHDWSPKSQLPPRPHHLYDIISEGWAPWLGNDTDASTTFRKGGYYTLMQDQLRMVILNTNFYYESNKLTEDMPDPANQLQWFDDVMTQATLDEEKVIVVAHVPPGQFEKHKDKHWFYPFYNDVFVGLLKKHAVSIGGIHMGHHHTDSFRIVYDEQDRPISSLLLAPAVTPWETTLPDVMGGKGNNPGIRLVTYDRDTGRTLDLEQHYLDLRTANEEGVANWGLEYRATDYYGIDDVGTESLADLAQRLRTDDDLFQKYYQANGVRYDPNEVWTEEARTVHCCAITNLNYEGYLECVDPPPVDNGTTSVRPDVAVCNAIAFLAGALVMALLC